MAACFSLSAMTLFAQQAAPPKAGGPTPPNAAATNAAAPATAVAPPPGYLIGTDDVLSILFWRDHDMSGDFTVRPDGKISVPLLNDVQAAGLTPEELRDGLVKAAAPFVTDPSITVVVKAINSRNVYITGSVAKPGTYPLTESMTVLQLIAKAGGLLEYADSKNIIVIHVDRRPDGQPWSDKVNYQEILDRRNLKQNIALKPGDTVVVK
jgi:polysaccharide export outer membrane protein